MTSTSIPLIIAHRAACFQCTSESEIYNFPPATIPIIDCIIGPSLGPPVGSRRGGYSNPTQSQLLLSRGVIEAALIQYAGRTFEMKIDLVRSGEIARKERVALTFIRNCRLVELVTGVPIVYGK